MKQVLEQLFPLLKEKYECNKKSGLGHVVPTSFSVRVRNCDITATPEELKNRTGIFIEPFRPHKIVKNTENNKGNYHLRIVDIFKVSEFKIVTEKSDLENLSQEEWVEKMMIEIGREIDRLCGKWVKKSKVKNMGLTPPTANVIMVTGPEIEGVFLEDAISFCPFNTDYASLWLYQKVLGVDQEEPISFSPAAEEKISKSPGLGMLKTLVTFTGNGGQAIGNYSTGSARVYMLPKKNTP